MPAAAAAGLGATPIRIELIGQILAKALWCPFRKSRAYLEGAWEACHWLQPRSVDRTWLVNPRDFPSELRSSRFDRSELAKRLVAIPIDPRG